MSILPLSVQEQYNKIADHFSRTRNHIWPETQKICELLKDRDRVLDLGCGNGRLLTGIKVKVDYTGIDFSGELLRYGKLLHPTRKFVEGDISKVEIWKELGKYDAIFLIATIHHIAKREEQLFVLEQVKAHLKEGGFFFLTCWNFFRKDLWRTHFSRTSLILKTINWRFLAEPYDNKVDRFYVAFDKTYLNKLIQDAGFKNPEIYYTDMKGNRVGILRGNNLCAFVKV